MKATDVSGYFSYLLFFAQYFINPPASISLFCCSRDLCSLFLPFPSKAPPPSPSPQNIYVERRRRRVPFHAKKRRKKTHILPLFFGLSLSVRNPKNRPIECPTWKEGNMKVRILWMEGVYLCVGIGLGAGVQVATGGGWRRHLGLISGREAVTCLSRQTGMGIRVSQPTLFGY